MDVGISRFWPDFNLTKPLVANRISTQSWFTVLRQFALEDDKFALGQKEILRYSSRGYFAAGIMGGTAKAISRIYLKMQEVFLEFLGMNIVNNEQMFLSLLYLQNPGLFQVYLKWIDDWNFSEIFYHLTD